MPRPRQYHVSRLNIQGSYDSYDQKHDRVTDVLNSNNFVTSRGNYDYTFFRVRRIEDEDFSYLITGLLSKFKREEQEEILDLEDESFDFKEVENKSISNTRFFLDTRSGLLTFHGTGEVRPDQFKNKFEDIFNTSEEALLLRAKIAPVTEEYAFFEELEGFRRISSLEIELHPANPNLDEEWKVLQEEMEQGNIGTMSEYFEAQPEESLRPLGNDRTRRKLAMVDDGYGVSEAEGVDEDGNRREITTGQHVKKVEAPHENNESVEGIFSILKEVMISVRERFEN